MARDTGICRACGENPDECLVGPYNKINKECNKKGGEAHHIVPDMCLRTGTRKNAGKGLSRIPTKTGADPTSLKNGIAICISDNAHKGLHKKLNADLKKIGASNSPPGQAPMDQIMDASIASIEDIGLHDDCVNEAADAVETDMDKYGDVPGRTTTSLPKGKTLQHLQNGG